MTTTRPGYFGTDGVRDVANRGMLTPERVLALGRALGRLAMRRGGAIAIASDPRRSSPLIGAALSAGGAAEGARVLDLGVLPTPALAALVETVGASLGAMVSASHNAAADNGIKVLSAAGAKLADADEAWLEAEMDRAPHPRGEDLPVGGGVGSIAARGDALDLYLDHLSRGFRGLSLGGLHVVVDAANGAMSEAAPRMLARLGARVTAICAHPDGLNINEDCGAVHPKRLAAEVKTSKADVGLAFDGDGDRLIAVSADGVERDGDAMLFVCARAMASAGTLAEKTVVGTVMTNFGFELSLREIGGRLVRTPVGDRHVAAKLREANLSLGGEPSGHLIFGAANRYIGDGLWSALSLLKVVRESDRTLADLASGLRVVPQVLLNVKVPARPKLETLPGLMGGIKGAESTLAGTGRVLVRYSGTENLLRVMVEGEDAGIVRRLASSLAELALTEIETAGGRRQP